MQDFIKALVSAEKNTELPETFNYFGKLIGSWKIDYVESSHSAAIQGEWYFAWVLEGMAVQDVIILPDYEYGTSLRIFNPNTQARKQGEMIVLTDTNDENRKWVLSKLMMMNFIGRM